MALSTIQKRLGLFALLGTLIFASTVAYQLRFRIMAVAWHHSHGDSVMVGNYQVPVPSRWFAEQGSAGDVQLWNSRTGESIWVHLFPKPRNFTLAFWTDVMEAKAKPPLLTTGRRDLPIAGEPAVCLEKDFETDAPARLRLPSKTRVHLPTVDCKSVGPLDVMFFGGIWPAVRHDYSEFYSIIGSIQRR